MSTVRQQVGSIAGRLYRGLVSVLIVSVCASCISEDAGSAPGGDSGSVLEVAWSIDGAQLEIGDQPIAVETESSGILIGDGRFGTLFNVDPNGLILGPLVTPGEGPMQALPPFTASLDGDVLFLIPGMSNSRPVVSISLWDQTTQRLALRSRADSTAITPISCGIRGCLVRAGSAITIGLPFESAGESRVDSIAYGWLSAGTEASSSINWFLKAPAPRSVSFEWPGGPLPFATGSHEFDLGMLVVLSGETVWWLDTATGRLARWRAGEGTANGEAIVAASVPESRVVSIPEVEKITAARAAEAESDLARNRIRATRDVRYLGGGRLPVGRTLVPARGGGVGIEQFIDGTPAWRRYFIVDAVGALKDSILVPGDVVLLSMGDSLAYGYASASDRVQAFRLPTRLHRND